MIRKQWSDHIGRGCLGGRRETAAQVLLVLGGLSLARPGMPLAPLVGPGWAQLIRADGEARGP